MTMMTMNKIDIRVLVRYCLKQKHWTRDVAKEICGAEGEDTASRVTVASGTSDLDLPHEFDFSLPPQLSSAVCVACNLLHEGEQLRLEFNQFLVTIIARSEERHRDN
ncbi:hypothetical protein KIN20_001362 [Parelaphostrongylus tenuis]|uniref:Uncharacterized protein n=1 Tax=Parelaphostrongylus tenuis TaxID=148309 RepID=A0AAD5LU01_PARTN|nr:hypothetical protein KIN20_001362 [Parelaphostrongylus tenuis]